MKNILEFLEKSAVDFPDKTAFADSVDKLSFSELLSSAQSIGTYLAENLHCSNSPVAVLLDKTPSAISAFFGVVYSGNFYTVLDSKMPKERMNTILDTLNPVAVLTDKNHLETAESLVFNGKLIFTEDAQICTRNDEILNNIRLNMTSSDALYALFTSGSTGVPKGVLITHYNVISYTSWVTDCFGFDSDTVFGNQTPFYFSMSVTDIFSTLKCAATMEIIPQMLFSFPVKLNEYLDERGINTIYWVPSALCIVANCKLFDYVKPASLKKVLFAGEVMPAKQLNYLRAHMDKSTMFANLFGPTETTDICTYYILDRDFSDSDSIPLGRHCDNCDVFITDADGNEITQCDVSGELYARGPFIAAGYYNNPEKTAASFVQNPLNKHYPEIVYKTGDLVKLNDRGELIYCSRADFQIKHMGYRIELGEIEAAVNAVDKVTSCVCVYDGTVDKIVIVYSGKRIDDTEFMSSLSERLPSYMLPNVIKFMKKIPLNSNGKLDRLAVLQNYKNID